MSTTIRAATAEDVPAVVALGLRFLGDPPYCHYLTADPVVLERTVAATVAAGGVFVGECAGEVRGMIAFLVFTHPFSGEQAATELAWYALEPRLGLLLLAHAELWAAQMGIRVLQMIAPDPRVERVYERRGYVPIETTYQRRLGD